MGLFQKKPTKLDKFVDPTGELSNRELRLAEWYARHAALLRRIGFGVLFGWCVITIGYSLFWWGEYAVLGFRKDNALLRQQAEEFQNYAAIQPAYQAADLSIGELQLFESAPGRFDFLARVQNPNKRWIATLTYAFTYGEGKTMAATTVLLPGENRWVGIFGQADQVYPTNPSFEIQQVAWRSVDAHAVPNVEAYISSHTAFVPTDFIFTPKNTLSQIPTNQVRFELTNATAYNFWEPVFYIELLSNDSVVGVSYISVKQFKTKETRDIDIRSVIDGLNVTDIRVVPVVDVFDPDTYMPLGS